MLKYLSLLLFAASAVAQPFPARPGPVIISQPSTGGSSSGGVDTNAVIALIEEYATGGGVVSNVTGLTLSLETRYTNDTAYYAYVSASVALTTTASGSDTAAVAIKIDESANGSYEYIAHQVAQQGRAATALSYTSELGATVPPGAAFIYDGTVAAGGGVDIPLGSGQIVYFGSGTNGGGGISSATATNIAAYQAYLATNGFSSGASPAQVAAIMVTNSPTISIVFEGDSLTHSNATSGTNTWANLISEANKISYRFVTTTNFAKAGDTLPTIISEYSAQAGGLTLSNRYNYFAICAGFNDIGGGAGSNNIKTYLTNIWRMATNSGYKVIASTITTNFTGSWTSGQAADYYAVNEWIKENPGYYSALLRPDLIINASSSLTGDGYHWIPAAHAAVAKQFNDLLFGGGDELLVASNLVVKSASTLLGETYLSGLVYSTNTIIFIPVDANYYKFGLGRYVSGGASLYNYQGITAIRGYGNKGFQVGNSSGTPILAISETGIISGNGASVTNLLFKTNYVAAEFAPTSGYIKFVGSNNALYAVSATKTNLISAP